MKYDILDKHTAPRKLTEALRHLHCMLVREDLESSPQTESTYLTSFIDHLHNKFGDKLILRQHTDVEAMNRSGIPIIYMRMEGDVFYRAAMSLNTWTGKVQLYSPYVDRGYTRSCDTIGLSKAGFGWYQKSATLNMSMESKRILSMLTTLFNKLTKITDVFDHTSMVEMFLAMHKGSINALGLEYRGSIEDRQILKLFSQPSHRDDGVPRLPDTIKMTAFAVLEAMVCNKPIPALDSSKRAQMEASLSYINNLRDSLAAAGDMVPMRLFKRFNDNAVYMGLGNHVARRESLSHLPEEVLVKIATLMALGEGSVDGVGVALKGGDKELINDDCEINHLELDLVVMVDEGLAL